MIETTHPWHDKNPFGNVPDIFRHLVEICFKDKEAAMRFVGENIKRYDNELKITLTK